MAPCVLKSRLLLLSIDTTNRRLLLDISTSSLNSSDSSFFWGDLHLAISLAVAARGLILIVTTDPFLWEDSKALGGFLGEACLGARVFVGI